LQPVQNQILSPCVIPTVIDSISSKNGNYGDFKFFNDRFHFLFAAHANKTQHF